MYIIHMYVYNIHIYSSSPASSALYILCTYVYKGIHTHTHRRGLRVGAGAGSSTAWDTACQESRVTDKEMRATVQPQAHAHTRGNALLTTCVLHAYKIGTPCNVHEADDRVLTRGECRRRDFR